MNPATDVVLPVSMLSLSDPERKLPMALVICDMSISLDGYVTARTTAARIRSVTAPG